MPKLTSRKKGRRSSRDARRAKSKSRHPKQGEAASSSAAQPEYSSDASHLTRQEVRQLVAAAANARKQAVAPYSGFRVGAAILTRSGTIISGANVESASYGLTCCAERVALFKALTEGHRAFRAVAVIASVPGGPSPCGACRQLLAEYAPEAVVLLADSRRPARVRVLSVEALLPHPFTTFRRADG